MATLDRQSCLFLLEAKTAANQWQSVEEVYGPGIAPALHPTRDEAHQAKAALKSLLSSGRVGKKKYPIRIRELAPEEA